MRGFPDSSRALSGVWFTSFLFIFISLGENSEGEIWPAGHTEDGTSEGGAGRASAPALATSRPPGTQGVPSGGHYFPRFHSLFVQGCGSGM